MLALIVAADEYNGIGKDNGMLWHLPEDFRFFKNITWGYAVIMGRKTLQSLGKALPGRTNIIITSKDTLEYNDVSIVHSLNEGITKAKELNFKTIFIGGGGQVYKDSMNIADRIYLTRVHAKLEAEIFFPLINKDDWELVNEIPCYKDEKHAFDYTFQTWDRIKTKSPE